MQGNGALKQQDFQSAEYYFKEALNLDPCFADALNNMGVLNSEQKHYAQAIDFFNKTLECNSSFLPAYFNRANALYESKEYYGLLRDAEYILKTKPDTIAGLVLMGLAQTKLRNYKEALSHFSRSIELDPGNAEHWVNRGTVKYYLRDFSAAASDFRKALTVDPNQANAINALGLIASDQNKNDSAKFYFEKALNLVPDEPYFINNLGYTYLQDKNFEKALELINRSLTKDPDNAWVYRNKGLYYLMQEDYPNAVRLLKQSLSMDEAVDKIHFYYAQALLNNNDIEKGCEQLKLAIQNQEAEIGDALKRKCQ